MSLNRIDGSQLNQSRQLDSFEGTARSNKANSEQEIPAKGVASDSKAKTGDTVEISDKAKQLMAMRQVYDDGLESVEKVPDVRAEKLELVRARLDEGFYNSSEVRDKVADGVLDAFHGIDEV